MSNINNQQIIPKGKVLDIYASTYLREFIEIGFISGGGFGSFYKAKHKLILICLCYKKKCK